MPLKASEMLQHMKEKPKMDFSAVVVAPMPGSIKTVSATPGQMVTEGQELCVIEAMKMQNSLLAGKTGKVCVNFYFTCSFQLHEIYIR
ncbi:unnamed protein product [Gongylonema pulchrum]|uniref:Lipoyl-binding domain-containing protein n=1 Tax=Gongylonema pulchrum TaxID=637853 RepID=A0A183DKY5_9BILA|nr:unnamed protein product [Gongylonema pulchrum]